MMMRSRRNTRSTRSLKSRSLRVIGALLVFVVLLIGVLSSTFSTSLRDAVASAVVSIGGAGQTSSFFDYFASKRALVEENAHMKAQLLAYERTERDLSLSSSALRGLCSLVNVPLVGERGATIHASKVLSVQPQTTIGTIVGLDAYIYGTVLVHFASSDTPPKPKDLVMAEDGSIIGEVVSAGRTSATVSLLSSPKHEVYARVGDSEPLLFVGKGAHTLEAQTSQEIKITSGDYAVLPGTHYPIGIVSEVSVTPEDATQIVRVRPINNPSTVSVVQFIRYEE